MGTGGRPYRRWSPKHNQGHARGRPRSLPASGSSAPARSSAALSIPSIGWSAPSTKPGQNPDGFLVEKTLVRSEFARKWGKAHIRLHVQEKTVSKSSPCSKAHVVPGPLTLHHRPNAEHNAPPEPRRPATRRRHGWEDRWPWWA